MLKKFFTILALILLTTATCAAAEDNFDILAAGYVDGENRALMLIRNKIDGEIFFMPFDAETETGAFVRFDPKIYNFYLNKDDYGGYPPLMFVMATIKMSDTSDDALGEWKDDIHLVPVYALFDVKDGQIIFNAPNFYSATGTLTPSHYHATIKNPIHTRLIEILMTKMPALHKDIQSKGMVLP